MKNLFIFIPVVIILSAVTVLALNNINGFFGFGKKIKEINSNDKGDIIATVNNTEIRENELLNSIALDEMTVAQTDLQLEKDKDKMDIATYNSLKEKNKQKTKQELLDKIIERKLIKQDIQKQNIVINENEIDKAVNETIANLEASKSNPNDGNYYENFIDLISGMGYTLEKYEGELLPIAMKETLESKKHYDNFKDNLLKENPDLTAQEIKNKYDDYVKQLVDKADIKLLKKLD